MKVSSSSPSRGGGGGGGGASSSLKRRRKQQQSEDLEEDLEEKAAKEEEGFAEETTNTNNAFTQTTSPHSEENQPVDVLLHPHQSIAIEGSCGVKVTSAVVCINGYLARCDHPEQYCSVEIGRERGDRAVRSVRSGS